MFYGSSGSSGSSGFSGIGGFQSGTPSKDTTLVLFIKNCRNEPRGDKFLADLESHFMPVAAEVIEMCQHKDGTEHPAFLWAKASKSCEPVPCSELEDKPR